MELALGCTYPLPHAEAVKNEVAEKLRYLEKLEIAIQGDDYADKEHQDTNHEALQYARAAAAVIGCAWSFEEHVKCGRKELALERLTKLPHVGPFRAQQIYELACTGTCEALEALCDNCCPLASNGNARKVNEAGRPMEGAAAKLALSRVLGVSALRAAQMYHGSWRGCIDEQPLRSLAELRAAVAAGAPSDGFAFGLEHYEELQEPVPEECALHMLRFVKQIVRDQQRCPNCDGRADDKAMGALYPLSPLELASRCACCWHVDFVGGARRRGKAGHDADLLVWHKQKAASWGSGRRSCVLGLLLDELERLGRLVPQQGGWQMPRMGHDSRKETLPGVRSHRRHVLQLSASTRGFENLSTDYHDKVFGVWRSAVGRHHRIDIIVNSFPEELPFTLLGWTGSRLLNRMMRQRAKELGLYLSSHALIATPSTEHGSTATSTTVIADGRSVQVPSLTEVPYEHIRSEEDIMRILAGGTDKFRGLYDPRDRNA